MVRYTPIVSIIRTEPRIEFIRRQLYSLLQMIELENKGEVVHFDGFRLKNSLDWLESTPSGLWSNINNISSSCNLKCEFCYIKGNPDSKDLPVSYKRRLITMDEVEERIKRYSLDTCTGIFKTTGTYGEPFCHPEIFDIICKVRQEVPYELIDLSTNGSYLSQETVAKLAQYQPIFLVLSLNSANPEIRQKVMGDKHPQIAIDSVGLLKEFGIPYLGSIVAWPSIPLNDVADTIRYLDSNESALIRVALPGYSRYLSSQELFNFQHWREVCNLVEELRQEITTPIYAEPTLFSEKDNVARVCGVVKNSPATRAGIKNGDIILNINSINVDSREHAKKLLQEFVVTSSEEELSLNIKRNGSVMNVKLFDKALKNDDFYPYKPLGHFNTHYDPSRLAPLGIFLTAGFDIRYIEDLKEIIKACNAKEVLLMTSTLMQPFVSKALKEAGEFNNTQIYIDIPKNNFYGGNIIIGDLLTVEDFIACAENFIRKKGFNPDLIVIPSSGFSQWGIDLAGQSYLEIQRSLKTKVALLSCDPIAG